MGTDAESAQAAYEDVLRDLVNSFELDVAFLRHNDAEARTTVLVAEWPPRIDVADPDPLKVVHFDADPIFALAETMEDVTIVRPSDDVEQYQKLLESASGFLSNSLAVVPMIHDGVNVGVLGFAKLAGRDWTDIETDALRAIAALLTQLHARVKADERFRYAASHDELTGLANRRALLEHLRVRLEEPSSGPVAVLFVDLDQLKSLNDFLGHLAGDDYILTIADILRRELTPSDVVARLGGDEFVVALHGPANAFTAERAAAAILKAIGRVVVPGVSPHRRVAVGIAVGHPGQVSADTVLRRADQAALSARTNGDTNIVQFTEAVQQEIELRSDVEVHLRDAIAGDALVLHFQPEVDLISHEITAMEALVRWQHPVRGLLPPSAFIPVAEATNLTSELGEWVLDTACRTLAAWDRKLPGLDITMRVNVSPAQLVRTDLVGIVDAALRKYGLTGNNLCLEITEVAVVKDLARTRRTLLGLRELGVHVAIDDFGTGYSALSHLKELPVDALKIDRAFVTDLGTGDELAIVRSIIGLADAFGLDIIAEGVETRRVVDVLVDLGCTRAQGYLISRPVPADDAFELLRRAKIDF